MMIKVGVTGGIGSGKSTVCMIFEKLGYSVYYADTRAKYLMNEHPGIIKSLKDLFGEEAYLDDGSLNRPYISQIVFKDSKKLQQLNSIVHPATGRDFEDWVEEQQKSSNKSFILKEAAILYESGAYKGVDAVISVYAPKSLRLKRVLKRDNTQKEAVLLRMDKQWPDQKKIQLADYVIYNDEEHGLIPQILATIKSLEKRKERLV